jgi:hypothetical protein
MTKVTILLLILFQTVNLQAALYDIADTSGVQGTQKVEVKIWLRDGEGYAGGQFEVKYDQRVLTATEMVAGSLSLASGFLVNGNTNELGTIRAVIAGPTRAKQPEGILAVIRFNVKNDAPLGNSAMTFGEEIKAFHENQTSLSIQTSPGTFTAISINTVPLFGILLTANPPRTRSGDSVAVEIKGVKLKEAVGVTVRLSYDPTKLEFSNFKAHGDFISPGEKLNENPRYIEIGVATLGKTIQTDTSLIGTVTFRVPPTFSTTKVTSSFAELRRKDAKGFETIDPKSSLEIAEGCAEDFDGSGKIDFRDFFLFAEKFGTNDRRFDLDKDGTVALGDFLIFTKSFVTGCK